MSLIKEIQVFENFLYSVMKTAFQTKDMKSESFWIFIIKILNFESARRICMFKEIEHITRRNSLNWVLMLPVVLVCIFV